MGRIERLLSRWVLAAILVGVGAGRVWPGLFERLAALELAGVNLVIAPLVWLMIYPMMLKVRLSALARVGRQPKGLALTLVVNWLVKPFSMALLGVLFFRYLFEAWVSPDEASQILAGMILLGIAPCTAMVFVWSHLVDGDPNYTLVQISLNDLVMVVAFAPLAALLLGLTELFVPWETLWISVGVFVVAPLAAGLVTQRFLGELSVERIARRFGPIALLALLGTVALLFAFQATALLERPFLVGLIAIPLLLQSYGIFALAYGAAKALKLPFAVAAPAALIGTSNFFELAVAVAISLFGVGSLAALATVVGVLIEVPVMLSLVAFARRTRHWFPGS